MWGLYTSTRSMLDPPDRGILTLQHWLNFSNSGNLFSATLSFSLHHRSNPLPIPWFVSDRSYRHTRLNPSILKYASLSELLLQLSLIRIKSGCTSCSATTQRNSSILLQMEHAFVYRTLKSLRRLRHLSLERDRSTSSSSSPRACPCPLCPPPSWP